MAENIGWIELELSEDRQCRSLAVQLSALPAIAMAASVAVGTGHADPAQAWQEYGSGRVLSEQQVYRFRNEFAYGQSPKAMYSQLGHPNRSEGDEDVWLIERIGIDGQPTGRYGEFRATYRGNKAQMWRADW